MSQNTFIFTINQNNITTIPVLNAGSSFGNLQYSTSWNGTISTVTVIWTSFTRNSQNDGLTFNLYYTGKTISVLQFGNIPLSLNGEQFKSVTGSIVATDIPDCSGSLLNCFNGSYLNPCNISNWDVGNVTNMSGMFNGASIFNNNINNWNISNVTNMSNIFSGAALFNQPLNNWDVGNVTNMSGMFNNAILFNQDISNWNVGNVTNMSGMFNETINFNHNINNWNVSNVTDMSAMFYHARDFNQPLNNWNVGNVTNMSGMFNNAILFNQDISNWNVGNVTNTDNMFYVAKNFNQPLNNWNVAKVTNMSGMFYHAENFNQPLNNWNVGNVIIMMYMFGGAYDFNQPLNNWNVGNVTNMMHCFHEALIFNQDISNWNVAKVTNMESMFYHAENFNQPLNNWNVSNVTDMGNMFYDAINFNQPLNNWNVAKVTNMSGMFINSLQFNQPLNNWNVSNVTNMVSMFNSSESFNKPLNNWNVSNVTNMSYMFYNTKHFNQDLSNWNVINVINTNYMFGYALEFNQPLNNWNLTNVTNASGMFYYAKNFNQPLNNWNVAKVTNMSFMFSSATNFNQDISNWNITNVTNMSLMFSNATRFNHSIGNWNFGFVNNIDGIFTNSGLSTLTYSQLLIDLSNNTSYSPNLSLGLITSYRYNEPLINNAFDRLSNNGQISDYGDINRINIVPNGQISIIPLNNTNNNTIITILESQQYTLITDSGGLYENYRSNENYNITVILPANATLKINQITELNNDHLRIYENDISGSLIYSSNDVCNNIITFTNPLQIFINFVTNNVNTVDGFIILVELLPQITSNICFAKGTPVNTDQGIIEIDKLTENNTINKKKVKFITKTLSSLKYLVLIKKDSIGINIPSQDTYMSTEHKVLYNAQFIKALYLPNNELIPYNGEVLYNVTLSEYDNMIVNNMTVETLVETNMVAKLYNEMSNLDLKSKMKKIKNFKQSYRNNNINSRSINYLYSKKVI